MGWVGSAERALEAAAAGSFDVAVVDIGLPQMEGLALTRALRKAGQTIQVLILTARDALRDRLQGLDMGADGYMIKPIELLELLARLRALLRRSQAATTSVRFVADAAQQLRTPLAALQAQVEAWAQAVEVAGSGPKRPISVADNAQAAINLGADQVLRLRQAVRRTSQLANHLLALSRADARSALLQPRQRVDLQQLFETVLESQLHAATEIGIDLGLEVSPAHISGHEWLLRELLINLVDNPIKYTPAGGHVTIRCRQHFQAYLEVEDNGPGIPEAGRDRVLERFCRVPGSPSEGSGLGLAIAHETALAHNGHLELVSGAEGRDLRVRLSLELDPHHARI